MAATAVGVRADPGDLLTPLTLSLLSMGLPLNIGGWGPREATTALAFGAAGLGAQNGFAAAVAAEEFDASGFVDLLAVGEVPGAWAR